MPIFNIYRVRPGSPPQWEATAIETSGPRAVQALLRKRPDMPLEELIYRVMGRDEYEGSGQ